MSYPRHTCYWGNDNHPWSETGQIIHIEWTYSFVSLLPIRTRAPIALLSRLIEKVYVTYRQ